MDLTQLLQRGEGHVWLYIPTAILLGILHGLEPGHSKTMMAAFIIAVRGTIVQAVLLGLSAAISHSFIIWVLAAAALHYGSQWNAESTESYFQIGSGVMILALAAWMYWRLQRDRRAAEAHEKEHANEGPHHGQLIDTGRGLVEVEVFETDSPPRFRLHFLDSQNHARVTPAPQSVSIETRRSDGQNQKFTFKAASFELGDFLESLDEIPEPHEFTLILSLQHGDHSHAFELAFSEDEHHHHHHTGLSDLTAGEYADAHERAHAEDIAKHFVNRAVSTPQIMWFGITGGLMPCPAAFTVLLICLQLKRVTLGFSLVAAFSVGLAITMVASGVLAAWGIRHAEKRFKGFGKFAQRAPYFSVVLLSVLAAFFFVQGIKHLS